MVLPIIPKLLNTFGIYKGASIRVSEWYVESITEGNILDTNVYNEKLSSISIYAWASEVVK